MLKFDADLDSSSYVRKVLEGLSANSQLNYMVSLRQLLRFVNSNENLDRDITIDQIVKDAKTDVSGLQKLLDLLYLWLQNKKVEGYSQRGKKMRESSANQRVYGYLRGFFANLDIGFERNWTKRIPRVEKPKQAIKKDRIYTFYDVDEKTKTIRFNRELMQQFLANLKLRDVAITLSLLSSSQDSGDLFKLNVGDIREQERKKRIFWEGTRNKTGVLFRTFLSKEATRFIRKYIEQERKQAKDSDPLFVYVRNGVENRMSPANLASIYRGASRKMGIKWTNGEHNPLRPKRMRHLFRTACDTAGVPELHTNAFMGHRNHMGQEYSELSKAKLELEYLRVEPFLTVYGQNNESLEIREDVKMLEGRIVELNRELAEQKTKFEHQMYEMEKEMHEVMEPALHEVLRLFSKLAGQPYTPKKITFEEVTKEAERIERMVEKIKQQKINKKLT